MTERAIAICELVSVGRVPALPLTVKIGGEELILASLLRVLPGQRYVGRALWRGKPVLAKLLVGGRSGRHWQREVEGAQRLLAAGLPTPALLEYGQEGDGCGWLLFEFLEGASSLWQDWQQARSAQARLAVLEQAVDAVASLHQAGLWQADLHLENLMRQGERLYLVDGGAVQGQPGQPLDAQRSVENFGMLLAQLPGEVDGWFAPLLARYQAARPDIRVDLQVLAEACRKVRRWRLRDYLKKCGRDCTLFSVEHADPGFSVVRRELQAWLKPVLANPDRWVEEGVRLKSGGSATVSSVDLDGRSLLIKRYNLKNFWHRLQRCWRPTRAWHSWYEGNRLQLLGIATPQPLAVIEERCCGLRGRSWLVTEYLCGQDIIRRFAGYRDSSPPEEELQALDRLFAAMLRERISHGDLKGTNIFWQDGQWLLIDLDALQQHRCDRRFARAWAKDRERFLRNWPQDSLLHRLLDQRLPRVDPA